MFKLEPAHLVMLPECLTLSMVMMVQVHSNGDNKTFVLWTIDGYGFLETSGVKKLCWSF